MNALEKLEHEAFEEGISLVEYDLSDTRIKGLYCDNTIAISDNLHNAAEKICVLAEELGHHYTTVGDIINQNKVQNRKQERQARIVAYNKLVGLYGIVEAYKHGCRNTHEVAEYLSVTEEFLSDAIMCYKEKYGLYAMVDNYIIYFEPSVIAAELF